MKDKKDRKLKIKGFTILIITNFIFSALYIVSIQPATKISNEFDPMIQNSFNFNQDSLKADSNRVSSSNIYDIPLNTKIEQSLLNQLITSKSNTESSLTLNIMILFASSIGKAERVEILKKYAPNCQIKYNYDLISAVSVELDQKSALEIIENIEKIIGIRYISSVHQTNLAFSQHIDSEDKQIQWEPQYSIENWWIPSIDADKVILTGKGVNIAVLDTGISVHPDFFVNGDPNQARITKGRNFASEGDSVDPNYLYDDYGHGTHCAGIAAGNGYLSEGKYRGVAPDANLFNVKISNSSGVIEEDAVIAGIEWSIQQGADILSMSFGDIVPEVWTLETLAIEEAVKQGAIVVAAAGNSGNDFFTSGTPASGIYSISVGATDINGHIAAFSSNGPSYTGQMLPDVCAPGVNLIATESLGSILSIQKRYIDDIINENGDFAYIDLSGTSMACPMVAGAIALLLEAFPEATPQSIRNALSEGAVSIERPSPEGYGFVQGAGIINVKNSLNYLSDVKDTRGSVNNQAILFPKEIPYAPFDLLKFPGDTQILNLSIFIGDAMSCTIEIPEIDGLKITPLFNPTIVTTISDILSLPLQIDVLYNASIGHKFGQIIIKNSIDSSILDTISIEFDISFPKGKILFETFHGLNDVFPSNSLGLSQIDLYLAMRDLMQLNYSLRFFMQNLTPFYTFENDAQIISPDILSDIDILVLQTPILQYSSYEIGVITDFFNKGGSILYLGTLSNLICVDSINSLFNKLNCGINVAKNQDVFEAYDYGLFAYYNAKIIDDINQTSIIFQDVDEFLFGYGNSFDIDNTAWNLANYNGKIIAAGYNNTEGKGNLIALGDYRTFRNGFYNDPYLYGNHSQFLKNIISFLSPNRNNGISIESQARSIISPEFNCAINIWNSSEPIAGLVNGVSINASIIFPNNTIRELTVNSLENEKGLYECNFNLNTLDTFNSTLKLNISVDNGFQKLNSIRSFFFYPEEIEGYDEITSSKEIITRNDGDVINFDFDLSSSYEFDCLVSITGESHFSRYDTNEMNPNVTFLSSKHRFTIETKDISNGGNMILFLITNKTDGFMDFTPKRISIPIFNHLPAIDLEKSTFGGVVFSDTITDEGSVMGVQGILEDSYEIQIIANDGANYEDPKGNLLVNVILFPILVYNGYINLLSPSDYPRWEVPYNSDSDKFNTVLTIPSVLEYMKQGETVNKSLESDNRQFYSLLWINVKDMDGESSDFFLLLILFEDDIPDLTKSWPLLLILGILAGIFIIIYVISKRKTIMQGKNNY